MFRMLLAYEYVDVLSRKLSEHRWRTLRPILGKLLELSQFTAIYYSWRPTSPDPGDDLVVDCAMNAGAMVITSNLRDSRNAEASLGLQVMTPVELVVKLAEDEGKTMSRLTLRLPETLHQQLASLAEDEGVSLNQYIVYALTRQITSAYSVSSVSEEEIQEQKLLFNSLLQALGKASLAEITTTLTERETVPSEKELDSNTVALLQQKIQDAAKAPSKTHGDA